MNYKSLAVFTCATALSLTAADAPKSGLCLDCMDRKVRPQDDIYLAMNGCWLANTEIPADRSNYGAFNALDDLSRERIHAIIKEVAAATQKPGSDAQKVGDFYRSFMDEERIEALGLKPLEAELAWIAALKTSDDVALAFAKGRSIGMRSPIGFFVGQDDKDANIQVANLFQGGTMLPDRDYYLKDDPKYVEARAAYKAYISRLLPLTGVAKADAEAAATEILALETAFAQAQRTKVELRNPEKNYNKLTLAALAEAAPGIPWTKYFAELGAGAPEYVLLGQPEFAKKVGELLASTPVETWKNYLRIQLMDAYSDALPKAVRDANFDFHGKALAGIPEDQPRWKKAVAAISGDGAGDFGALGDALGRLYVERHFPAEAKRRMDILVANLLKAYGRSIDDLTWMSPETKLKAKVKLAKYTTKIGYPEKSRDYSGLVVSADGAFGNMLNSSRLEYRRNLVKLGKAPDRAEWGMTPQTVNAYYNPGFNEIVFPAAILQPPFFNAEADDAVNYGGIGAVIGHEISHGFDDQGAQYDGDGNLKNWWGEEDAKAFKALTQRLVTQYNACEALPGKFVNGEFTLGENIADLSGVAIAYKAYLLSLEGKTPASIDGFTGDQRFFLGWSQVWRRSYREAELVKRLVTDPHSPSQFRANLPLMNSDAFHKSFDLKAGDKLYLVPDQRIRIW